MVQGFSAAGVDGSTPRGMATTGTTVRTATRAAAALNEAVAALKVLG